MVWLINKYKYNKKNIIFFIIGNFIAITFVSIGISSINQMSFLANEKNDGNPENTRVVNIRLQEEISIEKLKEIIGVLPKEAYYKIVNQSIYVDGNDKRIGSPLHIVFNELLEEDLKVIEGKPGQVMIGKKLRKHIKNNEISLYKQVFKIDGIISGKEDVSKWDSRIILNIDRLPKQIERSIKTGNFQLYVEAKEGDVSEIIDRVAMIIKEKGFEKLTIREMELKSEGMHLEDYRYYSSEAMLKIFLVYLVNIINLIFVTTRWIYGLKNEIGVMKCVGIKEITIIKRIFAEYIVVVILSLILSLAFQEVLYRIIGNFDIIYFKVTMSNLTWGCLIAIGTSGIVLLNSIRQIIYQSPAKLLRG